MYLSSSVFKINKNNHQKLTDISVLSSPKHGTGTAVHIADAQLLSQTAVKEHR